MKVSAILAQVGSYLKPQVLAITNSKYSGPLRVVNSFGDVYISTGVLTQTGGIVRDLWLPTVKGLKRLKPNSILILGLAGGTLARLISKYLPDAQITGVEIDPTMISLGKKYLSLDKINNLKIIIGDAQKNIFKSDVIFVDMYLNDMVPEFVYSQKFLSQLFKSAKLIIFNHLFYDDPKKNKAKELIDNCQLLNCNLKLKRVLTNLLIFATPKTRPENHTPSLQTAF